jgi:hypothetical protein
MGPTGQREALDASLPRQRDRPRHHSNASLGRPRGSPNKLGEQFIVDLFADWQPNGSDVTAAMAEMASAQSR